MPAALGADMPPSRQPTDLTGSHAKQLWELKVPGGVYTCTFGHDGKTVAAAGFQGKVILVDAATGKILKELIPVPLKAAG